MTWNNHALPLTRREALARTGMGLGWLGAASLFHAEATAAGTAVGSSLAARPPHFPARARAVIHIFANGGPSHLDTFDRKVALEQYAGREIPNKLATGSRSATCFRMCPVTLTGFLSCGRCMPTCPTTSRR
jgi:hypothetical protein